MKNIAALLFLVPSMAFAQLISDYRSQFETQTPIVASTIASGATNASNQGNDVSTNLQTPMNARPSYPTTITPLGDERNGYIINSPGVPNITCIPQGGGNMSCY